MLLSICFTNLKGSPQVPDYLIIGQDTIAIFFLPMDSLEKNKYDEFHKNLVMLEAPVIYTGNVRGYQAIWKLEDNKLYLTGLAGAYTSDKILTATFQDQYKNGKVLASWFSSYIVIPKGNFLRWDGVFSRTYSKEDIYYFKRGVLARKKTVTNYIDLKNGVSRLNKKTIVDTIFSKIKELDWKKFGECECDDSYEVTINEKGKISDVILVPFLDTEVENKECAREQKFCLKQFKKKLHELQFDIIKWNGKPYQEKFPLEIHYFDGVLENWVRYYD